MKWLPLMMLGAVFIYVGLYGLSEIPLPQRFQLSTDLTPTDDGYVVSYNPDVVVGDGVGTKLAAGTKATAPIGIQRGLIKWDLSSIDYTTITLATISLEVGATPSGYTYLGTVDVHKTDNLWLETSITWNNQPALGAYIGSLSGITNEGDMVQLEITSYVQNQLSTGTLSIILKHPSETVSASERADFFTKESVAHSVPTLHIEGGAEPTEAILTVRVSYDGTWVDATVYLTGPETRSGITSGIAGVTFTSLTPGTYIASASYLDDSDSEQVTLAAGDDKLVAILLFSIPAAPDKATLTVKISYDGAWVNGLASIDGPEQLSGTTQDGYGYTFSDITVGTYTVSGWYNGFSDSSVVTLSTGDVVIWSINLYGTPPPSNDWWEFLMDFVDKFRTPIFWCGVGFVVIGFLYLVKDLRGNKRKEDDYRRFYRRFLI